MKEREREIKVDRRPSISQLIQFINGNKIKQKDIQYMTKEEGQHVIMYWVDVK